VATSAQLAEQVTAGVELLASASVLGCFDGLVLIWQASTLHQVRARQLVFATGVVERRSSSPATTCPGDAVGGAERWSRSTPRRGPARSSPPRLTAA
jgi:hypothetical protein